jgi:Tol biopolymer transport system component
VCICPDFEDAQPAWSPDGTRIAFERWEDSSDPELWIMDADDSGTARRLLQERQTGRGPVWSPDGSRIAFAQSSAPTAESYYNRVLLTDGNGSAPVLVEQRAEYVRAIGGWTADGASLVFAVNHVSPANFMQPDLYRLHVATGAVVRLTTGGVTDSPSVDGRGQ